MVKTVNTSLGKSCSAGSSCRNQVDGFLRATIAASPTSPSGSIRKAGVVEIRDVPQGLSWTAFEKSRVLSPLAHLWFGPSSSWTSSLDSMARRNKRRSQGLCWNAFQESRNHSPPAHFGACRVIPGHLLWRGGFMEIRYGSQDLCWTAFQESRPQSQPAHPSLVPNNSRTSPLESRVCRDKRKSQGLCWTAFQESRPQSQPAHLPFRPSKNM